MQTSVFTFFFNAWAIVLVLTMGTILYYLYGAVCHVNVEFLGTIDYSGSIIFPPALTG